MAEIADKAFEEVRDRTDEVLCDNCGTETPLAEIDLDKCPECGEHVTNDPSPSRGSASVLLANDAIAKTSEEKRDVFRTLLHLLGCELIDPIDIHQFYYYSISDRTQAALQWAVSESEELEDSDDEVLVCPNCGEQIYAWAHWFDLDDERGDFFTTEEEGDA